MTALLRYAFLKTTRDGSFIAFALVPILMPIAALVGGTVAQTHGFHYPFLMGRGETPLQSATGVANMTTVLAAFFAVLPAFWTFRSEIASRSIGSLALATRPAMIVLALMTLTTAIMIVAWLISMMAVFALTTAWPPHVGMLLLKLIVVCLSASATGAAAVAISPEPAMVIAVYLASALSTVWLEKTKSASMFIVPLALSAIFVGVATFALERRCAR